MHRKIGGVQTERDAALAEAAHTKSQKVDLEKKFDDLSKIKSTMEEEIVTLKGTISNLEEKLSSQENQVQTLNETINTLNNNILNLQKQVEGLNETNGKLARDLESESRTRIETQDQLTKMTTANMQLEETVKVDKESLGKLESERKELQSRVEALTDHSKMPEKFSELQSRITELASENKTLLEKLDNSKTVSSTSQEESVTNNVMEKATENNKDDQSKELQSLKSSLQAKEEELAKVKQNLREVKEKLT